MLLGAPSLLRYLLGLLVFAGAVVGRLVRCAARSRRVFASRLCLLSQPRFPRHPPKQQVFPLGRGIGRQRYTNSVLPGAAGARARPAVA
jgi:hypothetical protein